MCEGNPVHCVFRSERHLSPTKIDHIAQMIDGELIAVSSSLVVDRVCTDSRGASPGALFIALQGQHTDGHRFLADAFRNGATAALISQARFSSLTLDPAWPVIVVPDPLRGLQGLARWHRRTYFERVLAITGSNGKTIVKDALRALLANRKVFASPGSYNSQLGLPLAILSAEQPEDMAILEVGISAPGEMAALEEIAAPDFGILTNIGKAHFSSFGSREVIAREKMSLFRNISEEGWILVPPGEPAIEDLLAGMRCRVHRLGVDDAFGPGLSLKSISLIENGRLLELSAGESARHVLTVKTRSPE